MCVACLTKSTLVGYPLKRFIGPGSDAHFPTVVRDGWMKEKWLARPDMRYYLGVPTRRSMLATVPDSVHTPFHRRLHVMLRSLLCARLQMETLTIGMPGDPEAAGDLQDDAVQDSLLPPRSKLTRVMYAKREAAVVLSTFFEEFAQAEAEAADAGSDSD